MTFRGSPGLRWFFCLLAALVVSGVFDLPVSPAGGPSIQASADARSRRPRRRSRGGPARPGIADDLTRSPGAILGVQMDRFFRANRPLYASFVALDPTTGNLLTFSQYSRESGSRIRTPGLYTGFPAASVFKIISSAALIEGGDVSPSSEVCYTGGRRQITMANIVDHARERSCRTMIQAFASSTNAVFAKLAVKHLTADSLMDMAGRFGFGKKISVAGRSSTSRIRRPEGKLSLARMAAGFTGSNMTTLHGAVIAAIVANGGKWPSGVSVGQSGPGVSMTVIKPETAAALKKMMIQAVERGTGSRHLSGIRGIDGHIPAIKTGTLTSRDNSGIWNNWVVGFYPADNPQIAFAAHVGHQGVGYLKAGHIVRYAIETWISLTKARSHQARRQ